ncbi:MAG TPA: tRNA uridine-5-carboxymethylaminomethyl(34) synthesis GTPase MnmE [Candidatus Hydrogenedentes bacterium]|nr:tRNA uridine-5-carboxymethylaminomethyl(34) synthesis GTPase MnmE [Candidatus Hydrogenedentota bacterium]
MPDELSEDTIAAISTPPGEGGVGIVRLSGKNAIEIVAGMFASSRGKDICKGRQRVFHGHIRDSRGRSLDEVLVHVMRAPHSYTTEDVVEINGHGGMAPLRAILDEALARGARLARPGEFTRRAFVNGRLDLSRAEAVMDLVHAQTRAALNAANAAASGALSRALREMTDTLADALARIEAAVDFPEEDLPELVDAALLDGLRRTHARMAELVQTADAGILYREGISLAIVGKPNVGKSSLFNALLRDARAIVSDLPGTTRDRLEETITLEGVPARLVDTAGVRNAENEVEAIGVERARNAAQQAGLILFVVDVSRPCSPEDVALAEELAKIRTPVVLVRNKMDLVEGADAGFPNGTLPLQCVAACSISATTGAGMRELERRLAALLLGDDAPPADAPMLFRVHQKDSMRRAAASLERLLENAAASPELLAVDLREALAALGEITGETTPENILDRIFASFCIGK